MDTRPVAVSATNSSPLQESAPVSRRLKNGIGSQSRKWWKYLLHFLINVAISDAFIIFKESGRSRKKRYSQLDSRLALAEELIGNFSGRKKPKPTHKLQSLINHIFVRLGRSRSYCKRCFVSAPRKRKDTCYGCAVCNVHLCSNACYDEYHRIHQLQEE
uniref:PiggyBac transposable element-derived protein 4 n=1 Tax=Magallana gigas TaxID=29159 RepID=A0A8W8MRC9_MAGGI